MVLDPITTASPMLIWRLIQCGHQEGLRRAAERPSGRLAVSSAAALGNAAHSVLAQALTLESFNDELPPDWFEGAWDQAVAHERTHCSEGGPAEGWRRYSIIKRGTRRLAASLRFEIAEAGATALTETDIYAVSVPLWGRPDVVIQHPDGTLEIVDVKTGDLKWKSKHEWGQSYASSVPVELQGQMRVLVFAGGESKPSTGGLLAVDPLTGNVDDAYFWRATRYTSVNAASPCLCGPNRVLVTQAYVDSGSPCNGAVLLEMTPERKWKQVWTAPELGCHWMTPVYFEDHLYAFSGEKEYACELVCYDAKTGEKLWGEIPSWEIPLADGRKISMGFKRGSLLHCDGKFLCLGEWGTLAWLDLSPKGMKVLSRTQPFLAQQSWTLPPVHQGLLYLSQHEKDELTGAEPRLICYDFRTMAPP